MEGFTIGGREAYQGNDSSRVATLQAVALCGGGPVRWWLCAEYETYQERALSRWQLFTGGDSAQRGTTPPVILTAFLKDS